jgi:hypothetical protein
MLDEWFPSDEFPGGIRLLCPAIPGYEKLRAPLDRRIGCAMFNNGMCELHSIGLKPVEGRVAHHSRSNDDGDATHLDVAATWNNDGGRALVAEFIGEDPGPGDYSACDLLGSLLDQL